MGSHCKFSCAESHSSSRGWWVLFAGDVPVFRCHSKQLAAPYWSWALSAQATTTRAGALIISFTGDDEVRRIWPGQGFNFPIGRHGMSYLLAGLDWSTSARARWYLHWRNDNIFMGVERALWGRPLILVRKWEMDWVAPGGVVVVMISREKYWGLLGGSLRRRLVFPDGFLRSDF